MSMKMRERGKKFFKMMANEVPQKKAFMEEITGVELCC